jgi:hypothetical protein
LVNLIFINFGLRYWRDGSSMPDGWLADRTPDANYGKDPKLPKGMTKQKLWEEHCRSMSDDERKMSQLWDPTLGAPRNWGKKWKTDEEIENEKKGKGKK